MTIEYHPKGVCSRKMTIQVEGDTITSLKVVGGCSGNLQGIAKLVAGRKVSEVIDLLAGTHCGFKKTSCPDQLAQALRQAGF